MTMTGIEKEFGFCPQPVEVDVGDVTIRALVDFDEIVEGVQSSDLVHDGWIYAGLQQSPDLPSRQIRERPFSARVFGLGKTHRFEHGSATGEEHVALKSELGLRPIYHHKPIRADGHLFITVIAYQLVQVIRTRLRQAGENSESWTTLRHVAHTKRQPSCPCIARADAATIPKQFCSSAPSGRILNRPAPTIRRHDFWGADS